MKILRELIPGAYLLQSARYADLRGDFIKIFNADAFQSLNIKFCPKEAFQSTSKMGVIRGMHFQLPPAACDKVVSCARGKIIDVIIDLRVDSACYGKYVCVELSAGDAQFLFVPQGCAHGFLSLEDDTIVGYLMGEVYDPKLDSGIRWDSFGFEWPWVTPIISDRDRGFCCLRDFRSRFQLSKSSNKQSRRRALVTGASGFVGSRVAIHLSESGWEVGALLRSESSDKQLDNRGRGIEIYRIDESFKSISDIIGKFLPDCIFHVAACTLHDYNPHQVSNLISSNITFGCHLVEAMLAHDIRRLVNTGTSWQHYKTTKYNPVNLYAATKQAYETILQYYVETRGLQVITLKLFDTYGAGDPRSKLLNLLEKARLTGVPLTLSPGEQIVDLVWIDDVVRAYAAAASQFNDGEGFERNYGVSGGDRMSLRKLVEIYEDTFRVKGVAKLGARPYRSREVMVPWSPDQNLPCWRPTENALKKYLSEIARAKEL